MNANYLRRLQESASKAAPYLDRLQEEQREAIYASAIQYKPKSLLERIRMFRECVTPEEFDQFINAPWFLELLADWDEVKKQQNTIALNDELYATIPPGAKVSRDDVANWVELERIKEESDTQ